MLEVPSVCGFLLVREDSDMAFDPKRLIDENLAGFEAALKAAYDQGVRDGIQRIVAAASAPIMENDGRTGQQNAASTVNIGDKAEAEVIRRAPRGLVPKVVGQMLADSPGKIIAEYEQMVGDYDSRVSEKSVGNELRRHEGKKYRRDDSGGWFPVSGNKEAEDAADNEQSSASDTQTQGEHYGTALDL